MQYLVPSSLFLRLSISGALLNKDAGDFNARAFSEWCMKGLKWGWGGEGGSDVAVCQHVLFRDPSTPNHQAKERGWSRKTIASETAKLQGNFA
jgi:hypothetical protein